MGSKNEPGQWDCYKNAEPDEPMFVLLARDPLAPFLVRLWAELAMNMTSARHDGSKSIEAITCARNMELWLEANRPQKIEQVRQVPSLIGSTIMWGLLPVPRRT